MWCWLYPLSSGFSQALSNNLDWKLSRVLGRHYSLSAKMSVVVRLLCAVITWIKQQEFAVTAGTYKADGSPSGSLEQKGRWRCACLCIFLAQAPSQGADSSSQGWWPGCNPNDWGWQADYIVSGKAGEVYLLGQVWSETAWESSLPLEPHNRL